MCDGDRIWKDSVWEIRMKEQVVAMVCWLHIYTFQPFLSEPLCNSLLRVGLVYLAGNQSPRAGTMLTISFVFHQYSLMPCLRKECLLLFDWQWGSPLNELSSYTQVLLGTGERGKEHVLKLWLSMVQENFMRNNNFASELDLPRKNTDLPGRGGVESSER